MLTIDIIIWLVRTQHYYNYFLYAFHKQLIPYLKSDVETMYVKLLKHFTSKCLFYQVKINKLNFSNLNYITKYNQQKYQCITYMHISLWIRTMPFVSIIFPHVTNSWNLLMPGKISQWLFHDYWRPMELYWVYRTRTESTVGFS